MSTGQIEELALPYDPSRLVGTVRRRRRAMISRIVSLSLSVVLMGGIYLWRRADLGGSGYPIVSAVVLGLAAIPLVVAVIGYRQARGELRLMPSGLAVRMGRPGVQVGEGSARWSEVASLAVRPGRFGRSERLALRTVAGQQGVVPLDQVTVHPATLDSTARAYSAGRHGVDLSALDN